MENYIELNIENIGKVKGLKEGNCNSFYGIPYGKVEKRFEKAIPTTWNDTLDVSSRENIKCCIQNRKFHQPKSKDDIFYHKEFREGLTFNYSEDCLTLNIYTPKEIKDNCPVLFFVHGGSFRICSNNEKCFHGKEIAKRNAILVMPNYRLNIFGFYADKNVANAGLSDVALALKWVHEHIKDFGGNPENITVMGQSAGAMLMQSLIINPRYNSMIKRCFLQSGGGMTSLPFGPHSRKGAIKFYNKLKQNLKVETYEELQQMDADTLCKGYLEYSNKHPLSSLLYSYQVYDGDLVDKTFYKNFIEYHLTPSMYTYTKNDLLYPLMKKLTLKYFSKLNSTSYLLEFTHDLPGDKKGAWHSADVWYEFGTIDASWRPMTNIDREISSAYIDMIIDFANGLEPKNKFFSITKRN